MAKIATNLFGELALLPFPAEAPVSETLEWMTDLLVSFNGTEEAIPLRNHPRQRFIYEIPEQPVDKLRSYIAFYNGLKLRWAIPMWTEGQFVGGVVINTQTIPVDTTNVDFRANSLALLYQNQDKWQVVEIASVAADSITIVGFTQAFQSAYLVPVRLGYLDGNVDRSSNGFSNRTKVRFELTDHQALPEAAPPQFLGDDLYVVPGLLNGSTQEQVLTTQVDRIDYDLGLVERRYPWINPRDRRPKYVVLDGLDEVRDFKAFLMRRQGRFRRFWEPTFERDLRHANTGLVESILKIQAADGFTDYTPTRLHIAVATADGTWHCRTVSSVADPSFGVVDLTLDTPLNIQASTIRFVSYLGLRRLDTDRVELNWIGGGVVRAGIATVEIQP